MGCVLDRVSLIVLLKQTLPVLERWLIGHHRHQSFCTMHFAHNLIKVKSYKPSGPFPPELMPVSVA